MIINVFWLLILALLKVNASDEKPLQCFQGIRPGLLHYTSENYKILFPYRNTLLAVIPDIIEIHILKKYGIKVNYFKDEEQYGDTIILKHEKDLLDRRYEFQGSFDGRSLEGVTKICIYSVFPLFSAPVTRGESAMEDLEKYADADGDVIIQGDNGEKLKTSSFVLAARCLYFRSRFSGRWRDSSRPLLIDDVKFVSVNVFVKYLFLEKLPENAIVGDIFDLADRYQCNSVKSQLRFTLYNHVKNDPKSLLEFAVLLQSDKSKEGIELLQHIERYLQLNSYFIPEETLIEFAAEVAEHQSFSYAPILKLLINEKSRSAIEEEFQKKGANLAAYFKKDK